MTSDSFTAHNLLWSRAQRARLVRLCTAVVGDPGAAEDLAQETLLEAWRHRARLTEPAGADAWLDAIARNVCRRWLRALGRLPVPMEVRDEPSQTGDLDSVLEREELVELLDRALGLLPVVTREALVGHYVEELSHSEIADRAGTTADAVSMRVSRGRLRLRYLLETEFAEDTIAEGWSSRGDAGWRSTRLRCVDCGRTGTLIRQTPTEVAFRCPDCDPGGMSVRLPLDAPAFTTLLGGVRRPSAVLQRVAAWTRDYWASDSPRCVRCDRPVTLGRYAREEPQRIAPSAGRWSNRHGWYAACSGCGEEVSGSVAGQALALPEVQAARRRDPRLRALPEREIVRDGAAATVVGFGDANGTAVVSAVFLQSSLRLVHLDTRVAG